MIYSASANHNFTITVVSQPGKKWVEDENGNELAVDASAFDSVPGQIDVDGSTLYKMIELEAEIEGTITTGSPASGPSYASGGEPADPDEVDITAIGVYDIPSGAPLPKEAASIIIRDHLSGMIEKAMGNEYESF